MWRRILGVVALVANIAVATCHGYLAEPKARNVVHNSNYCPHCLAAGGPGVTYAGGRTWPNSKHGVCGDPASGPLDHEAGGKYATKQITAAYVKGQRITLRVKITAPHGGRFLFGVCPVPDGASATEERRVVTQACFDKNRLKNALDGSDVWWLGKKGVGEYTMDFVLPPGLTCKRCVLQWHYETGNSCNIPGTPPQYVLSANMVSCASSGNMEEFWNCADVSIQEGDGGRSTGATKRPKRRAKETFLIAAGGGGGRQTQRHQYVLAVMAGMAVAAVAAAAVVPGFLLLAVLLVMAVLVLLSWVSSPPVARRRRFRFLQAPTSPSFDAFSEPIFSKVQYTRR